MAFGTFQPYSSESLTQRPDAQGYQGQTAQPSTTSSMQGPQGAQSQPATSSTAPTSSTSSFKPSGTVAASAAPSSPVTSTGTIPPAQPAPAPVPQQTAAPPTPNPFVSHPAGGVYLPQHGMWVPGDHPLAQTPGAISYGQGGTPSAGAPGSAPRAPGTNPTQLLDQAMPTYQGATFTQFGDHRDPIDPRILGGASDLMASILQNPLSMSDQHVRMLQEQQKEQALAQQSALLQALGQQRAASGFEVPGGAQLAQQRRIGEDTNRSLLQGNRDIALAKMQQDRADQLAALAAAQGFMGAESGRQIGLYGAQLGGEQAQAGEGFKGYGSQADAFAQHQDTALRAQQLALQQALGQGGLDLDARRLSESARQFDKGFGLDQARLMEAMLQGRLGYGLDLAQLQQLAQGQMFQTIFGQ